MRLAVCTLSAVLLSGCSWLGYGGGGSNFGSGASCGQYAYGSQYSQAGYAGGAYGAGGCGVGGGYGSGAGGYGAGAGYGANGYGPGNGMGMPGIGMNNGYGVGTGALGLRGVQGAGAYGAGMGGVAGGYGVGAGGYGAGLAGYGAGAGGQFINGQWVAGTTGGAGTVLGGAAPYGTAAGGQYINGQWVSGMGVSGMGASGGTQVAGGYGYGTSGSVTTVQGAPIYVPQPYPAYYGVGYAAGGGYAYGGGLRGGYAALPFGIEAGVGTDIAIGGDIIGIKPGGPALGGVPGATLNTSGSPAISYGDAYKNTVSYDMAATYDIDPSTTLIGRIGYSQAEGERIKTGTVDNSLFVPAPGVVTSEDLYAQWSDLEQITLEGGARKYLGGWNNAMGGMRPYVQATAGFTHNNGVSLSQDSATLMPAGSNVQPYIDSGWTPTASGVIGAEMQVGPRTAIGVEAGIRWSDDLNTIVESEDRWSVPVKLRGRISF